MKAKILLIATVLASVAAPAMALGAEEPIIPPSISKVSPAGMERGTSATFTVEGRNLTGAERVVFDAAGITAKVTEITDVAEKISGPRAGVDLGAQVPLGRKQTAELEMTVAKVVKPGLHWFRVQTPLGTSNLAVLDVGALPEVHQAARATADSTGAPQAVTLPATLIGTLAEPGDVHRYEFEGKTDQEFVFEAVAAPLGSALRSLLTLHDSSGQVLAQAGQNEVAPDAVLTFKLPEDGKYTLAIADRDKSGGADHFYRVNAGPLPYITGVFPLGVRAGQPAQVTVQGINLGGARSAEVQPPAVADGWTTTPLSVSTSQGPSLNTVALAVGDEAEMLEQEPNSTAAEAQVISLPATINGHIDGGAKAGGAADEDYFRFHAQEGERVAISVAASRLGSPLDSVIEVLDAEGHPIPRATVRCLNQTTTTLSDRDSRTPSIRLQSTSELHERDYLMVGDELDQVSYIPDQPDADTDLESINGLRRAFLGTSPDVHAVNTPVYKAEILPPGADFPPNGLPVFHLTWRNDDGGPGYGADSRLDFVAPKTGDYLLHLRDVRGLEGTDYAYRLTLHDARPDFQLRADPDNPNIPRGGSAPVTVSADRLLGYQGPIEVDVQGLLPGITASRATIPAGQDSGVVILSAAPGAAADAPPASIKIVGRATVEGREIVRDANAGAPLQLAAVMPPPDLVVTAEPSQVAIAPGEEVKVTLHVARQNGFKGRVPCSVENLPPGVRVVNVGLNGVLVTEDQTTRTFTLRAEDWAKPIDQPIYVVGVVESNSSTLHPSAPLLLRVENKEQAAASNTR